MELLVRDDQKGNPATGARINGIYALEKLASADPKQYGAPVMKTLVAYIRDNAQRTALPIADEEKTTVPEKRKEAAHLGDDVKAAFAALKRLHDDQQVFEESGINQQELSFAHTDFRALRLNEIEWIKKPDLSYANLTDANLIGTQLNSANLTWAQLHGANLKYAQLNSANFRRAQLHDADFWNAQLHGADFWNAQLHGADFRDARLHGANLRSAELHGADLSDAQLHGADLRGARLYGADLRGVQAQYTSFEGVWFEGLAGDSLKKFTSALEGRSLSEQKRTDIVHQAVQKAQVEVVNWKVWHISQFLDNLQIDRSRQDVEWGLEWWEEIKEDVDAQVSTLKGLLRNFAGKDDTDRSPRAKQCRLAVKQLLQENADLRNQFTADDQWERMVETVERAE